MSISVDPASAAPLADLGSAAFLGWTRRAGLLLPNAEEAAVLTGARDPEAAAWALAKDGREVVITLGKEGALWSDGERVERGRASPAPARVDSTGAGDAFTAGWLAARLSGEEPGEALAAANFAAAQVLKEAGAREVEPAGSWAQPSRGGRREGRGSRCRARRPRRRGSPG